MKQSQINLVVGAKIELIISILTKKKIKLQ